jgi:signal transduction histidine kinase
VIFFAVAALFQNSFGTIFTLPAYILAVPIGIGFVILYEFITHYLKYEVTTRLINPNYNPSESAEKFSNEISLILDIANIAKLFNEVIDHTIRPGFSAIIFFPGFKDSKEHIVFENSQSGRSYPADLEILTSHLWRTIQPSTIIQDEIEYELEIGRYRNMGYVAKNIRTVMLGMEAKVLIPLRTKDRIIGLYIFGQKEADSPYTTQDLDFLTNLANSASVAIERAMLYSEVQQFAATLQTKVDVATAELLKTNADLAEALKSVQEARRREHDMMDVMGHELRTPISIVRNALAMLRREAQFSPGGQVPAEKFNKYIDMGLESSRREITLIETLLSSTKIDASRLQLYYTQVDFKDVVNDAIEGQRLNIGQKPLVIQYFPPTQEITVYCDRTRVQEIVDNFLSNAVKYTLQGTVAITQWRDENMGYISIKDTGIGVDAEDLQKLGKKFFRAKQYISGRDSTQVVRPGGTGLGLYVTFELIRAMGGHLWVNSQVGKGTTFTFTMPLYRGEKDNQFDQTFDPATAVNRDFITINGQAPQAPGAKE